MVVVGKAEGLEQSPNESIFRSEITEGLEERLACWIIQGVYSRLSWFLCLDLQLFARGRTFFLTEFSKISNGACAVELAVGVERIVRCMFLR